MSDLNSNVIEFVSGEADIVFTVTDNNADIVFNITVIDMFDTPQEEG